jgi:DNA-binding transcriptional ArsR family regulator
MRHFLLVAKALADNNRLRALLALRGRELCVCQIVELLALAPSTVSKHLAILEQARLVERRKDGRWVHYRRPAGRASEPVNDALRWLDRSLANDPAVREDTKRLREILKIPAEELCGLSGRK